MKFGKELLQTINQSCPEWAPFWINYKTLKKQIKKVIIRDENNIKQLSIEESELEIQFFTDLRAELRKLTCFYISEEKHYIHRFYQLKSMFNAMKNANKINDIGIERMMVALAHFYTNCIKLENFAVVNYQGFSKILKKHDKYTGYDTKIKYMRKMVNQSPISNHPNLLLMLTQVEKLFNETKTLIQNKSDKQIQLCISTTIIQNPQDLNDS